MELTTKPYKTWGSAETDDIVKALLVSEIEERAVKLEGRGKTNYDNILKGSKVTNLYEAEEDWLRTLLALLIRSEQRDSQ